MTAGYVTIEKKKLGPGLGLAAVFLVAVILLRQQGRLWLCSCGQIFFWGGDIWSSDNSQHLFDPYSFRHLLHGVAFFWGLVWLRPGLSLLWRLCLAAAIEASWEVAENSAVITYAQL
jgi:hypothetical protein